MFGDNDVFLTDDAWRRMSAAVRAYEREKMGVTLDPETSGAADAGIHVRPTGCPVPVQVTTAMGPNDPDGHSIPAPKVKVVYPGRVISRQMDHQDNDGAWLKYGDPCWIIEANGQGLWVGRNYKSSYAGQIGGVGVFVVSSSADPQKIAVVSHTPELTIAGVDYWPAIVLMWDQNIGDWTDETPFDNDVLIFSDDGSGFTYGQEVTGKLIGPVIVPYGSGSDSGYGSAVVTSFVMLATGGGSSDMKMIRITGWFLEDNVNAKDFWPGIIQTYDPTVGNSPPNTNQGGGYEDTETTDTVTPPLTGSAVALNVWVESPNSVYNNTGQNITVGNDGTCYRLCRNTGRTWDPTGLINSPTGPHAHPVYEFSDTNCLVTVGCGDSDGMITGQFREGDVA